MDRIGESFTGIVASVSDFGMWIELKEVLAEGLVRLSSLTDDYYVYWPNDHKLVGQRTARMFTLGQSLSVRLSNVSLARQEIDLELDEPDRSD
jgi:ribonuclease R